MGTPLTEESKALLRLLSDGQERRLDWILARVAESIAPGRALRKYEERSTNYHAKYGERKSAELSDDEKIASGGKYLAKRSVRSLRANYLVITDTATGPVVKLRPGVEIPSFPKLEREEEASAEAERSGFVEKPLIATEAISEVSNGAQRGSESDIEAVEESRMDGDPEWIEGGDTLDPAAEPVLESVLGPRLCDLCGMFVGNEEQHAEFHERYPGFDRGVPASRPTTVPACAFFSEGQVRAIVAAEVGQALDEFQRGMQKWLVHRFAAVESLVDRPVRTPERGSRW